MPTPPSTDQPPHINETILLPSANSVYRVFCALSYCAWTGETETEQEAYQMYKDHRRISHG
jgi:hypothetical protein